MKYDVFISYRRAGGKDCARSLKEALEKKGYSVFLDIDELKDGHFIDAIYRALDSSHVFLLIMSEDIFTRCTNPDDHVRNEIQHALGRKMNIVPVVLDKKIPAFPEGIPTDIYTGISSLQYSFLDTEHLFRESIAKIVKERIAPVAGKKKRLNRNKKPFLWGALAVVTGAVVFGVVSFQRLEPEIYIDYADSIIDASSYPITPEDIKNARLSWLVRYLYDKGAKESEKLGLDCLDCFNQSENTDYLENAFFPLYHAGYAYQCLGDYASSIDNYSSAVSCGRRIIGNNEDCPDSTLVGYCINNLAYSYLLNGEGAQAIETIDDAITFSPESLNTYDSKGELLFKLGRYSEALQVWDYIHEKDPYFKAEYWVDACKDAIRKE